MRTIAMAMIAGLAIPSGAGAADEPRFTGSGALALAALVGIASPLVAARDRDVLLRLLDGRAVPAGAARRRIVVAADAVTCRASSVDIAHHDCTLTFGNRRRVLAGRAAHELYATLAENGVEPDGAAGSTFRSLSALRCDVDVAAVRAKGGGGASCAGNPGP